MISKHIYETIRHKEAITRFLRFFVQSFHVAVLRIIQTNDVCLQILVKHLILDTFNKIVNGQYLYVLRR